MAKKTIRVSDRSGEEIAEGKGATVRINFADARKGVRELDLTDTEAVDHRTELLQRVQPRFSRPPVVALGPVAAEVP